MLIGQQTLQEWAWLLQQISPFRSLLEIGSYDGASLMAFSAAQMPGGVTRSIDDAQHDTAKQLRAAVGWLKTKGFDAECRIDDSHLPAAVAWAAQWAPYDVVFIDGDHSYDGVKADWNSYAKMGRLVCLHDVFSTEPGVVKFWQEIVASEARTKQMAVGPNDVHPFYKQQGVGIVLRGASG
jgi:predicted O-methyltransferase YrrM